MAIATIGRSCVTGTVIRAVRLEGLGVGERVRELAQNLGVALGLLSARTSLAALVPRHSSATDANRVGHRCLGDARLPSNQACQARLEQTTLPHEFSKFPGFIAHDPGSWHPSGTTVYPAGKKPWQTAADR